MKKALLIYAVAATAVAIAALRGRARLHDENRRLGANIETLTDNVDLYRTKSGESAAEITSLRLRCSELERLNGEAADRIRDLGIRLKRVTSAATAVTASRTEFDGILRDSIIRPQPYGPVTSPDTLRTLFWSDTWTKVHAIIRDDSVSCRIESVDTLHQVVYRIPRRFLFIRFGTKELRQVITSSNPHTRLVYTSHITVEKAR